MYHSTSGYATLVRVMSTTEIVSSKHWYPAKLISEPKLYPAEIVKFAGKVLEFSGSAGKVWPQAFST